MLKFYTPIVAFALATTLLPVRAERDTAPINSEQISLPSHKKAKNECLAWIILISSGSVGLDFLKWFKNFNTCLLVIS